MSDIVNSAMNYHCSLCGKNPFNTDVDSITLIHLGGIKNYLYRKMPKKNGFEWYLGSMDLEPVHIRDYRICCQSCFNKIMEAVDNTVGDIVFEAYANEMNNMEKEIDNIE